MAVLNESSSWPSALSSGLLWAAAAASAVFWTFRLMTPADAAMPPVAPAPALKVDQGAVARVLGARFGVETAAAPVEEASKRFVLFGVIADESGRGAALFSVDGKAARPYRAGQTLANGYVLKKVEGRSAYLVAENSPGDAPMVFALPVLPVAESGPARELPQLSN